MMRNLFLMVKEPIIFKYFKGFYWIFYIRTHSLLFNAFVELL